MGGLPATSLWKAPVCILHLARRSGKDVGKGSGEDERISGEDATQLMPSVGRRANIEAVTSVGKDMQQPAAGWRTIKVLESGDVQCFISDNSHWVIFPASILADWIKHNWTFEQMNWVQVLDQSFHHLPIHWLASEKGRLEGYWLGSLYCLY